MFQFPGWSSPAVCIRAGMAGHRPRRVPPFGDPRIEGCVPLPADYRSLPRPSSTSCAKASAVRPWYLHHHGRGPSSGPRPASAFKKSYRISVQYAGGGLSPSPAIGMSLVLYRSRQIHRAPRPLESDLGRLAGAEPPPCKFVKRIESLILKSQYLFSIDLVFRGGALLGGAAARYADVKVPWGPGTSAGALGAGCCGT